MFVSDDNDMIFSLDEDHSENLNSTEPLHNNSHTPNNPNSQPTLNTVSHRPRPRSPLRIKHTTHRHKHVKIFINKTFNLDFFFLILRFISNFIVGTIKRTVWCRYNSFILSSGRTSGEVSGKLELLLHQRVKFYPRGKPDF